MICSFTPREVGLGYSEQLDFSQSEYATSFELYSGLIQVITMEWASRQLGLDVESVIMLQRAIFSGIPFFTDKDNFEDEACQESKSPKSHLK